MKITPQQRTKIGLFTFIGLLIFIGAVFFIGNQKSVFSSTFKLKGVFNNVSGLQVGNNVRLAGINVGVVDNIEILNDTSVVVVLTVEDYLKKHIKKDSKISIGSDGLMGDKLVVIMPGAATTTQMVKDGDQIGVVNPVDMDKVIGKLTHIANDAGTLIENLSQIASKVNSGQGSIGRLLNNDKMAKDMENTVKQAQTTMRNVHKTTTTLNEDLTAAQHNFLLKGFFKKKKKAEEAKQDSIKKAQSTTSPSKKK